MKKVILIVMGVLMGLTFVNAQTDSIKRKGTMQSPGLQPSEYQKQDRIKIKQTDIPASLKQTLKGDANYEGWENSTLYRDKSSSQYSLDLLKAGTTTTYYFDKNGKAVPGPTPSYNSSGDPNESTGTPGKMK